MAARSLPRNSCSASSITPPGRISILPAPPWVRRRRRSTRAGVPAMVFGCWTGWSQTTTKRANNPSRAMTEVLFYHLQNMSLESVLPPLLEKSLERGWRVVVQSTSQERTDALDTHLWTYRDDSFLPHATWRAGDAQDQPIVLAVEEGNPNGANVRFLIDSAALPADSHAYERMVLVFNGDDGEALAAARGAWTDCRARGFEVTYWQADERGRWQRRE